MVYYRSLQNKRRLKRRKFFLAAGAFLVFLLILGLIRLIVFSKIFEVKSVYVQSGPDFTRAEVLDALEPEILNHSLLAKYLGPDNIWIWGNSSGAIKGFLGEIPQAANVSVNRSFFGRAVTVSVTERPKYILWCGGKNPKCFWADKTGFLFKRVSSGVSSSTIAVYDDSGRKLGLSMTALPANEFSNLEANLNFLKALKITPGGVKIENLAYREMTVETADHKTVYMSLTFSPYLDGQAVQNLIKDGTWNNLNYLDLRVEDRIYYR